MGRASGVPPRDPDELLPLTPAVFHILLALAGGERHGYGIMQEVSDLTGGQTQLGPGTLYRSIQKMVLDGLIEEVGITDAKSVEAERRRVYRMTPFGRQVARSEARRLAALVGEALSRRLLTDRFPRGKEES
jgi:DNA-binding PadR family transcriptional regulator